MVVVVVGLGCGRVGYSLADGCLKHTALWSGLPPGLQSEDVGHGILAPNGACTLEFQRPPAERSADHTDRNARREAFPEVHLD